jgi:hypothetical protein
MKHETNYSRFTILIAGALITGSLFFVAKTNAEVIRTSVTVTSVPLSETTIVKSIDISAAQNFSFTNADNIAVDFTIPQNVYTENVKFTANSHDEVSFMTNHAPPSGKVFTNKVHNFVFEKLDGQVVQTVSQSVTITLHYSDADLVGLNENTLSPYRKRESDASWSVISGSTLNTTNNTIIFSTNQFSFFALLAEPSIICGNGTVESGEQCDSANLAGASCSSRGFTGGTLSCNSNCTFNTSQCSLGGGGGGGGGAPPPSPAPFVATSVVLKGKAYPYSDITILKDGEVAGTTIADSQANFSTQISNITAGVYTFGVWAEDDVGNKSITFSFTTSVVAGTITTIGGIFLPPTIYADKTSVARGDRISFLGQTAPKSEVSLHVNSQDTIVKKFTAGADGLWSYALDTSSLEEGFHISKSKATSPDGLLSSFSKVISFIIGKKGDGVIKGADFNGEGKVNLIDFSILLFNWGVPQNPASDLNSDGHVNIVDFSILLFYWTG